MDILEINKVNQSFEKIQPVLESVQEVEGGLKFDPSIGGLVLTGSIIQHFHAQKSIYFRSKTSLSKILYLFFRMLCLYPQLHVMSKRNL